MKKILNDKSHDFNVTFNVIISSFLSSHQMLSKPVYSIL